MAKEIDFGAAWEEAKGFTGDEAQKQLDDEYGEGGDVMSSVGIANIGGMTVALARMVTPAEILSFGKTIEVRRDDHNIIFISDGILLLARPWDEATAAFADAGDKNGFFMFESITPTKIHRALVGINGQVIPAARRTLDISKDEYEKHLAGFYVGPLGGPKMPKPFEC